MQVIVGNSIVVSSDMMHDGVQTTGAERGTGVTNDMSAGTKRLGITSDAFIHFYYGAGLDKVYLSDRVRHVFESDPASHGQRCGLRATIRTEAC